MGSRALLGVVCLVGFVGCYSGVAWDGNVPCNADGTCDLGMCQFGLCVMGDVGEDTEDGDAEGESSSSGTTGDADGDGDGDTDPDTGSSDSTSTTTDSDTGSTDDTTSDTESTGDTGGDLECDPNDPEIEVYPEYGDQPGDPCCTDLDSCTGDDVMGEFPQEWHQGEVLVCSDGIWVIDNTPCIETCAKNDNGFLGCFWDSEYSDKFMLCGCQ